ncbi:MAG: hypothetical protein QOK14_978, partial [Frankiaceae bacterium]|nr:hypothetical protein [Frankiaceae bacterium]
VVATNEPGGGDDVARRQYAEARALWVRRR